MMSRLRELLARFLGSLRPARSDADLEAELRAHLELAADDERRRGTSADEAARAARLRAGALAQSTENLRDQRGLKWLDEAARDVRYGLRMLRRQPAFAVIVLLTLAVGIGANAAVFSVLNAVVLKPLSYPNADELVAVWHTAPGAQGLSAVSGDLRLSASMYFTYAEQNRTFEHLGVWFAGTATVTGVAEPEEVRSVWVSGGVLQALATPALVGRWLSAADQAPGGAQAAVLSYGYWQRRFGADPAVVGRNIVIDAVPRTIVGVMPQRFRIVTAAADVILPTRFDRSRLILPGFGFQGVARLKPGVTVADANADIARLVPIWMNSWPAAPGINPHIYENWRITPAVRPLKQDVVGAMRQSLWILMAVIGIVMLIACANVATLLLVRAEGRQQEFAIRAALGAGSGRLVRALLFENLVLAVLGGAFGLGLADVGLRVLAAEGPASLPRLNEVRIDGRALLFTLAVALVSSVLFGLMPALKQASLPILANLSEGGRTQSDGRDRHRARNGLVIAQVALAVVLLISAGLMIRTFQAMHAVDPGFADSSHLQMLRLSFPASLVPEPERVARMQKDIVDKLAALPGVGGAGFASAMPMEGIPPNWDAIRAESITYAGNEIPPFRLFVPVSPGFFHAAGTRLIAGRDYTWTDMEEHRPRVIVSENLARELWGSPSAALGKRLQTLSSSPWWEVVGVVQDVYDNGVQQPAPTKVYWPAIGDSPYRAIPIVTRSVTVVLRTRRAGTEGLITELQREVWSVNPSLSVASVQTMRDVYDRSMARTSFALVMLSIAGAMALTLGLVGIYGVIAHAVSRRTREIGIRLALGAQRAEVMQMFVRSGLRLSAIGLPIGLGASVALTRLMSSLLYGISPWDPATFLLVSCTLVSAVVLASYLPARRASGVDPVEALK